MLSKNILIYVKTTETCNLNCSHCFTSGINGKKIYFKPKETAEWVNSIKELFPDTTVHLEYHGGEPFLASIESMVEFYKLTKEVWKDDVTYGATTNLVYALTEDKINFMESILSKRIGTSWDPSIRFDNNKQKELFEKNVKTLLDRGFTIKLFVSLTQDLIQQEPIDFLRYVKELGVQEMSIERLTSNGNAKKNRAIFPTNKDMQEWFLKMHHQMVEHNARDWFDNEFMENVYAKFESNFTTAGTFCRNCEQKLFTINADGTVAGCPNSAPEDYYATIFTDIDKVITSEKRCKIIASELTRNSNCYQCPVYKYCGGDCHQLEWEGDICPAPKTLMLELHENIKPKYIEVKEIKWPH